MADHRLELVWSRAPDEAAECLDDRGVRQRAFAEVDAPAGQDPDIGRGGQAGQGGDEPCLSDAGLAGNEEGAALTLARTVEPGGEPLDLARATDQDRAGDADGHVLDYRPRPDRHHRRTSLVRRLRRCVPVAA